MVGPGEQLEEPHQAAAPGLVDAVVDQRPLPHRPAGNCWFAVLGKHLMLGCGSLRTGAQVVGESGVLIMSRTSLSSLAVIFSTLVYS